MPTTKRQPSKARHDDSAQSKRFIEAAHEAEAEETKESADRAFKKVVSRDKGKRS